MNIIVPYHEGFDVAANFVVQTVKALNDDSHNVHVIAFKYPKWFIAYFLGINSPKYTFPNLGKNVIVFPFLTLIPNFEFFPARVKSANKKLSILLLSIIINCLHKPIIWSFDYEDLDLIKKVSKETITLYDCVDFFSSVNQKIDAYIQKKERKHIESVDLFFVNSNSLQKAKKNIRNDAIVVPLGFDLKEFAKPISTSMKNSILNTFTAIPKPRIGYIGNLTYRFDFKLLKNLMHQMPNVSFVFVGTYLPHPTEDAIKSTMLNLNRLKSFKNAYFLPIYKRTVLKFVLEQFTVCMIPYNKQLRFNRYCFPMKLLEYFYVGKPIVSTHIHELTHYPKYIQIGNSVKEWHKIITKLIQLPWHETYSKEQRKIAINNSWDRKVSKIVAIIKNEYIANK